MMTDFSIIGKPIAMIDAAGKTTAPANMRTTSKFRACWSARSAFAAARTLASQHRHFARQSARRRGRGRHGEDAPNTYGILPVGHDETALAVGKVRYVGDHVACVAAIDEETAERALELIDVDYEPLPAWFDPSSR